MRERVLLALVSGAMLASLALPACRSAAGDRRQRYIDRHETKYEREIRSGKVARGMTTAEVEAALGRPTSRGLNNIADRQTWLYLLKTDYDEMRTETPDPDAPSTDRVLHVMFDGGIVVDWAIRQPGE